MNPLLSIFLLWSAFMLYGFWKHREWLMIWGGQQWELLQVAWNMPNIKREQKEKKKKEQEELKWKKIKKKK